MKVANHQIYLDQCYGVTLFSVQVHGVIKNLTWRILFLWIQTLFLLFLRLSLEECPATFDPSAPLE